MQQQQQCEQQQQKKPGPFVCYDCGGVSFNSAKSLEVHIQYHKDNLLRLWGSASGSNNSEGMNNNNTSKGKSKREPITNSSVATVNNSDSMQKKSPEYSGAPPDTNFGHPPTPQSCQSGSSPYQNQDNTNYSPNYSNFQQKVEKMSPNQQQHHQVSPYQQGCYSNYSEPHYFPMEVNQNQQYPDPYLHNKMSNVVYRYHPYSEPQQNNYEQQHQRVQVPTPSPAYPPHPTPSPSPKQCDKCGYVCDTTPQLIKHDNEIHPPTPAPHIPSYQSNQQNFMFDPQSIVKQEDNGQREILDLDSHKVVHNVFPEGDKRQSPHSVSTLNSDLNSWNPTQQQQQPHMFMNPSEQKIFPQTMVDNIAEEKLFSPDPKVFQSQLISTTDFMTKGIATTSLENAGGNMSGLGQSHQGYRPFEHLGSPPGTPVVSTSQVPNSTRGSSSSQKSTNWKSNEARRPKTYNCTACNKWFTSSGHLKRHYNTTLHRNAVKSSGQPDPATMPISAHHHPARDNNTSKQEDRPQSGSSGDDIRGEESGSMPTQFERMGPMSGLLQQPPSSAYDQQPPAHNIHHTPLSSPMGLGQHPSGHLVTTGLPNLSNGSSPNGEAGLSTTNVDSRGLLSFSSPPINTVSTHGFNMVPQHHMMQMDNNQFEMYPNESAPHVTQAMDISSHNTSGEFNFADQNGRIVEGNQQPLPSFAQIQAHRFSIIGYDIANVGGGGSVTTPFTACYMEPNQTNMYPEEEDYKLMVLNVAHPAPSMQNDIMIQYSPENQVINTDDQLTLLSLGVENDPNFHMPKQKKIHIMEDINLNHLNAEYEESPEQAHIKRDYEDNTDISHISSTSKKGEQKCYNCDKVFNKACYLTQHNKTFHSGEKPFKCARCGKRFSNEATYEQHTAKHAGEKPHKCEICPKQFNHKTDLRRHMCLHTGKKPYACECCGKGFIRKDHMVKHCETHKKKSHSKTTNMR